MNKLLPVVRFNSYFGDWDKNKLKNLASFSKGKGYTKSDLTEQGQPIILYGRLYTKYEAVINSVDTFAHLKDNSVLSEGDEVIVPGSGETSEDISRASVIGESGIIIGGDLNVIKPTKKINSIFLALTISNGRQQKELSKRAQGNSVVHLYNSNLKEVSIIFPEKEEQEKIGSFFNKLDKIITLQQQLLNDHKQLKKAMLQKMFPQKGESVPSVRFAGFTEDWHQIKLGSVTERITRKNKNLESVLPLTISAQHGLVDQTTYFNKQIASKNITNYYLLEKGEFAYNKSYSKGYPWGVVKRLDKYDKGVLSTLYIVFKLTNINSEFLVSYYDTKNWHKEVSMRAAEGVRNHGLLNITAHDFFDSDLKIPISDNEQTKIGNFFKQLDENISFHQTKLDTYQELKKAMLQKMFV